MDSGPVMGQAKGHIRTDHILCHRSHLLPTAVRTYPPILNLACLAATGCHRSAVLSIEAHAPTAAAADDGVMTAPIHRKTTNAFYIQAALSFGVALVAACVAIVYLPVESWIRAFLALSLLYVVTSSFTLAKCVRDHHESTEVVSRIDQARLDKLLTDHDPFKVHGA